MNPLRTQYLRAMGIEVYRPRSQPNEAAAESPDRSAAISQMNWDALAATVAQCTACQLHAGRRQAVLGTGDRAARWMFIGEAPGAEEDRQGEPFVGRAGQLLNAMLAAVGIRRDQVYIANVLKCRPPNNRDPLIDEAECCAPFLQRQLALIQPSLVIALGRIAAHRLLDTDAPLSRLRGRAHALETPGGSIPLIVTYHPAYLLRSPREKRKAWDDLQLALGLSAPAQ